MANSNKYLFFCKKCNCSSSSTTLHKKHLHEIREIPNFLFDQYVFEELIGFGGSGGVFRVFDPAIQIKKAIKIIFDMDEEDEMDLNIMRTINHQYLINYFGEGRDIAKGWGFICMELADMDLKKAIEQNIFDSEEKKYTVLEQICKGVSYLHLELEPPVIHRDLKPKNILITKGKPRITDFGISRQKKSSEVEKASFTNTYSGTEEYMPPEIISRKKGPYPFNDKHDIWSLGIIAHQIFTGKNPFQHNEFWFKNICDCNYQIDYKKIAKNSLIDIIIQGCLKSEPKERVNIKQILELFSSASKLKSSEIAFKNVSYNFQSRNSSTPSKNENELDIKNREEIIKITTDLSKNKSYSLCYNKREYQFLNKHQIDPKKSDKIYDLDWKGVVLSELNLGTCDLELAQNLSQTIQTNDTIEILIINDFSLAKGKTKNLELIFESISKSKSIKTLGLEKNGFDNCSPEIIEIIFKAISQNNSINQLMLNQNDLGLANPKNLEIMFKLISQNKNIDEMILANNGFAEGKTKNLKIIFNSIIRNEKLHSIGLQNNGLGIGKSENLEIILKLIVKNKSITNVVLLNNGMEENSKNRSLYEKIKKKRIDINWVN